MTTGKLIEILKRFDPESKVRLCVTYSGRVISTSDQIWVADYGGGPQLIAAPDLRPFQVLVGCGLEQVVRAVPRRLVLDLGEYEDAETAEKVRDFYIYHTRLAEPLTYPDFDYENWIPPRTKSGKYHERIAAILKRKFSEE